MRKLALCALAFSVLGKAAYSANFNCSSGDTACLIAAIHAANSNNEDNAIFLEAGDYKLTAVNNTVFDVVVGGVPVSGHDGSNGLPSITGRMTIRGPEGIGSALVRDESAPDFRIFHVEAQGNLTLSWLNLTGGRATAFAPPFGGGAILSHGTLSVNNSVLYDNVAAGWGGAITNQSGSLSIRRSTIRDNRATLGSEALGGGVYSHGTAVIEETSIHDNHASDVGGGIYSNGELLLLRSTIASNSSFFTGGGIIAGGTTWIEGSSIYLNSAASQFPTGQGAGGIANSGAMTIVSSTVSRNQAVEIGVGGVLNNGPSLVLRNVTVTGNTAGGGVGGVASTPPFLASGIRSVRLENTIIDSPQRRRPTPVRSRRRTV